MHTVVACATASPFNHAIWQQLALAYHNSKFFQMTMSSPFIIM